jgi:hypothetical protein
MPIRITDVREITQPISSPIRNAYIDFSKTSSVTGARLWATDSIPMAAMARAG